ncbi:nucleotidyltransferase family protein [Endozoicomonas acroporae]|uniref:nucleotidyltransferase family protein n=1 Tax=Endozoicomonas acroporae TaxID=1701104 RepID=UPI000C76EB7A|nr:nucleotidyltransferase family protein [Endozoicomonas acroporae]
MAYSLVKHWKRKKIKSVRRPPVTSVSIAASNPGEKITAVILAAGKGTRFNGHKMMHDINGIPMAIRSALNAQPHVHHVLVIVRPQDHRLKRALDKYRLAYTDNPDFAQGMSSSIVQAIDHIPDDQHILLCLGDMPHIEPDTYQCLIAGFRKHEFKKIIRPIYQSEDPIPAHPVLFPAFLQADLKLLSGDAGARSILKIHQPILLETSDEGVIKDIDYCHGLEPRSQWLL